VSITHYDLVKPGMGSNVAVALVDPKYPHNVGAAVRAASCFGLPQVWFSGTRVDLSGDVSTAGKRRLPREERMKGYQKVSLAHCDYFFDAFDSDVVPVAIEVREGAESLPYFEHPDKALYVFGPEDGSLHGVHLRHCHRVVQIPMAHCANLASAVYMTLYDRHAKRVLAGLEQPIGLDEHRGWMEPDTMIDEVGVI
jgi:tRNA(Leu) C34 or U34 (ribose-2'-O)-methylase TrmL